MNKVLVVGAMLALLGLGVVLVKGGDHDYGRRPVVTDVLNHNDQMNACVKAALAKHPGAVVETEVEMESDKLITDVDIQGADGKNWEVECELATTQLVEDKPDN